MAPALLTAAMAGGGGSAAAAAAPLAGVVTPTAAAAAPAFLAPALLPTRGWAGAGAAVAAAPAAAPATLTPRWRRPPGAAGRPRRVAGAAAVVARHGRPLAADAGRPVGLPDRRSGAAARRPGGRDGSGGSGSGGGGGGGGGRRRPPPSPARVLAAALAAAALALTPPAAVVAAVPAPPPVAAAAAAAATATATATAAPATVAATSAAAPAATAATPAGEAADAPAVTGGEAAKVPADVAAAPPAAAPTAPARRFGAPKWSYDAPQWSSLSDAYKLCADAPRQSPIDLRYKEMVPGRDAARPSLDTAVAVFQAKRAKAGSTSPLLTLDQYVVRPPPLVGDAPPVDVWSPPVRGAILTLPGVAQYGLVGFDVHAGSSEHAVGGVRGVAELHFLFNRIGGAGGIPKAAVPLAVVEDKDGGRSKEAGGGAAAAAAAADARYAAAEAEAKARLTAAGNANGGGGATKPSDAPLPPAPGVPKTAIVSVVFKAASDGQVGDPFLTALIKTVVPASSDEPIDPVASLIDLDLSDVLPPLEESDFSTYVGSTTTPPCTENVRWIVYGRQLTADAAQVAAFVAAQGGVNARPVQSFEGVVERYAPIVGVEAPAAAAGGAAAEASE